MKYIFLALSLACLIGCGNDPVKDITDKDPVKTWVDISDCPLDSCSGLPLYIHEDITREFVFSDTVEKYIPGDSVAVTYFGYGINVSGYDMYRDRTCTFWANWFKADFVKESYETITYDLYMDWILPGNSDTITLFVKRVILNKQSC